MNRVNNRLRKEINELIQNPVDGVFVNIMTITHWKGTIIGPKNTPYENLDFKFEIKFDNDYPFVPPNIRFITLMWHPNVAFGKDAPEPGKLVIDMLTNWSPAYRMSTILEYIKTIFGKPEEVNAISPFCLPLENPDDDRSTIFELWETSQQLEFEEKYKNVNFEEKISKELSEEDFELLKIRKDALNISWESIGELFHLKSGIGFRDTEPKDYIKELDKYLRYLGK